MTIFDRKWPKPRSSKIRFSTKKNLDLKCSEKDSKSEELSGLSRFQSCFLVLQENRLSSPTSRVSGKLHPDRFLEEFDYERRLKKRKLKLVAATEDAFAHLGRVSQDRIKGISDNISLLPYSRIIYQSKNV